MKLEKAFMIDGKVVGESFQKGNISVYETCGDSTEITCYFVDNKTGDVLFKQDIYADMGQGTGYISNIHFEGVNK